MKKKLVAVYWYDCTDHQGWAVDDPEANKSHEMLLCVTVGFLVAETKEKIVISSTHTKGLTYGDSGQGVPRWGGVEVIPRGFVKKMFTLKWAV